MPISRLLLLIFLLLIAASFGRSLLVPSRPPGTGTPLVWVSGSNPARLEQVAKFNELHPDLNLSLDMGDSGTQKIILQSSSGVGPDIFDVYSGEQLQTYAEAGILWDITEAAQKMGFSAKSDIWPSAYEEVSYQGRQYAYPCNLGVNIVLFNKNVFDHFQVPYPEGLMTWEQFQEVAAKVGSPSRRAQDSIYSITGLSWLVFFESMGGEFFTEGGKPLIAESAELKLALEMHRDYMFKHQLMPTSVELKSMSGQGGWGAGSLNQFASGKFAMLITGEWAIIGLTRTFEKQQQLQEASGASAADTVAPLQRPLRLGCVLIPKFADRRPYYRVRSRAAAINAGSPRREEALAFLQYLAGPEYSRLVNREADFLPGNPEFAELGVQPGPPELSRMEMHETTKEGMRNGYTPRRSPYLATGAVVTALNKQVSRLESDPSLPIEGLLQTAENELKKTMHRNLSRDEKLRKRYEATAGDLAAANNR